MAHSFDTGLSRAQRTLVRSGAVTLLAGLKLPGGYLRAVIPWGGVVRGFTDDMGIDLLWEALRGRAPAIAIALGDKAMSQAGMGGFNLVGELELLAYVLSMHPRDTELGRHEPDATSLASNTADPGLDTILEHVEELLIGQRAGASATIKQIRYTREDELRTEGGYTLWVQRYTVTVGRTINPNRGISEILRELRATVRTSDDSMAAPAAPVVESKMLTDEDDDPEDDP